MKLDEILDPSQRERVLQSLKKQYAPLPKPSPEEIEARETRAAAVKTARQEAEALLLPIAQQYSADDFEGFKQAAEKALTPNQLKTINLQWAFDTLNPERKEQGRQSWQDLADEKFPNNYRGD